MRILGVIPARYGSTRFPGKALAELSGKPLVLHVVDRAREAGCLDRLVVATDDERIAEAARGAGAEAMMTPGDLPSGSDRAAWVEKSLGEPFDAVMNIQGDEPFLPGAAMDAAAALLERDSRASLATLAVAAGPEEGDDPHSVKVVLDKQGRALYFSRSRVPHGDGPVLKHVGLYVFRTEYLRRFVTLGVSPLEARERLEQLRALEDGARIAVAVGDWTVLGVDTPPDLRRAAERMERLEQETR